MILLMKKILGLIVLCFLLNGCTTATQEISKGYYKIGITKHQLKYVMGSNYPSEDAFMGGCYRAYYPEIKLEVLSSKSRSAYYIFDEVYEKTNGCSRSNLGDGKLALIKNNRSDVEKYIENQKSKIAKKIEPKKIEPKKIEPKKNTDDTKIVAASSGTGFFVSNKGHIVTNHHVIDQCKILKVSFKGKVYEAKVLAVDKSNDLAIIKANINQKDFFKVSQKDATLLQDIIVAGFPLGKQVSAAIKTHKGTVTALAGYGDNYSNFQTDATINQGNSGGPVLDLKGNIVGVAVALLSVEAGQNIFFAVKSSTLITFANSNDITFTQPNNIKMSNEELGEKIINSTVYLECHMTLAKIKQLIIQEENKKALFNKFKQ